MVLLLRPTGLSDDPERKDWSVDDDGAVVGRICENLAVANPELRWFWFREPSRPSASCEDRASADA